MTVVLVSNGEEYSDFTIYGILKVEDDVSMSVLEAAAREGDNAHRVVCSEWWDDRKAKVIPSDTPFPDRVPYFLDALRLRGVQFEWTPTEDIPGVVI